MKTALAAAVEKAVRRHLVDRECKVRRPIRRHSGTLSLCKDEAADLAKVRAIEVQGGGIRRRLGKGSFERPPRRQRLGRPRSSGRYLPPSRRDGSGAPRQSRGPKARGVVKAHQPEPRIRHDNVQEGFVALALFELSRSAAGPDRFADARARLAGDATSDRKSRQAWMIQAGFAPTSAMSANRSLLASPSAPAARHRSSGR